MGLELAKVTREGRIHSETSCTCCRKKIRKYESQGAQVVCHSYRLRNSLGVSAFKNHLCIYLCDVCYTKFVEEKEVCSRTKVL